MPLIDKSRLLQRLKTDARNSSHFVWLLADLKFFESERGWVFAFTQWRDITLVALEPLIPEADLAPGDAQSQAFQGAWGEFVAAAAVQTVAFVGVYRPFLELLHPLGFETLKVGQEPWIWLNDCIPRGNSGKGVRGARNQALRAGLQVEEWKGEELTRDPERLEVLKQIVRHWRQARLLELGDFLNKVDPFAHPELRRYFIVRSEHRVEGFLVATPVSGLHSYFLEDLLLRKDAPNGCGELTTLEAMVALSESGEKKASLGVISMTTLADDPSDRLPASLKRFLQLLSRVVRLIYKTDGLEIYRRRFKPHEWTSIHLAVKQRGNPSVVSWLKVLVALLAAFRPRLQPSREWLLYGLLRPFRRYALTFSFASINFLLFWRVNHFGKLPDRVLDHYGTQFSAPLYQWPLRSITSDFLYFDRWHFLIVGGLFLLVLAWAERTRKKRLLLSLLVVSILLDDVLSYCLLVKPFELYHPWASSKILTYKDVGSSLLLTTLLGLQLQRFRLLREPLFALLSLVLVMIFLFDSPQIYLFAVNLNHMLFFVVGFLTGKVQFELTRKQSRQAARMKPPVAKCVLPRGGKAVGHVSSSDGAERTPGKQAGGAGS